jgi:hypothetical protein
MVGARVYPDIAPMGVAAPYVVWSEIGNTPMNNLSGGVPDVNNYRVQVVCFALTALRAREVAEQVRTAMVTSTGFKALEIDYGSADFEEGSKVFGVRMDFSIWYRS